MLQKSKPRIWQACQVIVLSVQEKILSILSSTELLLLCSNAVRGFFRRF